MSILPPSNSFLVLLTRLLPFYYEFVSQAMYQYSARGSRLWSSLAITLAQNGMIRVVWCEERWWAEGGLLLSYVRLQLFSWFQQQDYLHYILMKQISIGFSFFPLFCIILIFDCVMEQGQCCLFKY